MNKFLLSPIDYEHIDDQSPPCARTDVGNVVIYAFPQIDPHAWPAPSDAPEEFQLIAGTASS